MKKFLFTFLVFTLLGLSSFAQVNFKNGAGDQKWSTAGNWVQNRVPEITDKVIIDTTGTSILDQSYTIQQLQSNRTHTVTGTETLTIDRGVPQWGILLVAPDSSHLLIDCPVVFNNTGGGQLYLQANNNYNTIEMGPNSSLELISRGQTAGTGDGSGVLFNGPITGSGPLFFGPNTKGNEFGPTADLSGHTGEIRFIKSCAITINMADDAIFSNAGQRIQSNGTDNVMTVNSANVLNGYILVVAGKDLTMNINADQTAMDSIVLGDGSSLVVNVGNDVEELVFGDCSSCNWGTGTVTFTAADENVIYFGENADALTSAQLAQITVNGETPIGLDEFGAFIFEGDDPVVTAIKPLKVEARISYPTETYGVVYFNTPVNELRVISLAGTVVKKSNSVELNNINLSDCTPGIYLLAFKDKVERIVLK